MKAKIFQANPGQNPLPESPLLLGLVPAGWPSPAEDYVEGNLNLHEYVVKNPAATYFARASGESMLGAGIHDGDLLVIDRSVDPAPGKAVVAIIDGELTVKYYKRDKGRTLLVPANPNYKPMDITNCEDATIWGVVTYVLHKP